MKQIIMILICSSLITGCKINLQNNQTVPVTNKENYYDSTIKTNENNIPLNPKEFYFPIAEIADTFSLKWYSSMLYAMEEPLLFNKELKTEVYRFTWLRTFHNPVAIRIESNAGKFRLFWKVCDGKGGYSAGKLIVNDNKLLKEVEWNNFKELLGLSNFWKLPTHEENFVLDGAKWILEGVEKTKYHVVDRFSPSRRNSFYICCDYLIGLTDLKFDEKEKY